MFNVKIYETDSHEKEEIPYFNEELEISALNKHLVLYIGELCRKFKLYFKHGELVFEPNEKLKEGL